MAGAQPVCRSAPPREDRTLTATDQSHSELSLDDLPISPTRLLEESPNGWLLTDAEGKIRFSNARAIEFFGYSPEELLGQSVELLVPERLRGFHLGHRETYMAHPVMRPMGRGMELMALRKDGSEFPVEISLSPMPTPSGTYMTVIVRDITDRVEIEEAHNNLRVELEMERERDRIGMDLHDGIMQELYAAGLTLELALADVRERPDAAEAEIERSIEQLHAVISNIRSYIFDLRPREFAGTLCTALSELAREFKENTELQVEIDLPADCDEVDTSTATIAYRIVHEALSNVRKHAHATQVWLKAQQSDHHVVIEVRDDGRGFDQHAERPPVHRGLRNMEARARAAGCRLSVWSKPGEGTCVSIAVPLSGRAPA